MTTRSITWWRPYLGGRRRRNERNNGPTSTPRTLLAVLAFTVACTDNVPTALAGLDVTSDEVRSAVVGSAAIAIGPDGRFGARQLSLARRGELSGPQAATFATAWLHRHARMIHTMLQRQHGATFDLRQLSACGRPLYARSSIEAPPADIPAPFRRTYGPWWLITFCKEETVPAVSVAVSAWATELRIVNDRLRFPRVSGNEFVAMGIPLGHRGEFPTRPEEAVVRAAKVTGKRVAAVPELVLPLKTQGLPQNAAWRLTLDRPTRVRTPSGNRSSIYAVVARPETGGTGVFVPAAEQPAVVEMQWWVLPRIGQVAKEYRIPDRSQMRLARLALRSDTPTRLEPVNLEDR